MGTVSPQAGPAGYGESPPESNLTTKAPTMKASSMATAIEVTGLTAMKIVRR